MLERRLRERVQQSPFAADVLEVGDQFLLDAVVRARVHLVHGRDQQIDEAVGDLGRARVAEARQQRQPHLPRVGS